MADANQDSVPPPPPPQHPTQKHSEHPQPPPPPGDLQHDDDVQLIHKDDMDQDSDNENGANGGPPPTPPRLPKLNTSAIPTGPRPRIWTKANFTQGAKAFGESKYLYSNLPWGPEIPDKWKKVRVGAVTRLFNAERDKLQSGIEVSLMPGLNHHMIRKLGSGNQSRGSAVVQPFYERHAAVNTIVNEAAVWIEMIEFCSKARSAKEASKLPNMKPVEALPPMGMHMDLELHDIEDWLSIQAEIAKDMKMYPQGVGDQDRFGRSTSEINLITGLLLGMSGAQVDRQLAESNLTVRRKIFFSQMIKNARNLVHRKGVFAEGGCCSHVQPLYIAGQEGQPIPWFRYLFKAFDELEPEARNPQHDDFTSTVLDVIIDVYLPAAAALCPDGVIPPGQTLESIKHSVNVAVWKKLYKSQWLEYQTECATKSPLASEIPANRVTLPMAWLCWDTFGPFALEQCQENKFCIYAPDGNLDEMKSATGKRPSDAWKKPMMGTPASVKRIRLANIIKGEQDHHGMLDVQLPKNPKIIDLSSHLYKIPLAQVLSDSKHGTHTHFELVIVKIITADGLEGFGYTYTGGHGARAIRTMIMSDLRPVLLGHDATPIELSYQRMQSAVHYVGRGGIASFAISAVDIALWDLKCKRAGMPLCHMLGGHNKEVRCYAGGIDLHMSENDLLLNVKGYLEAGHDAVKIKLGKSTLEEDISRVKLVREFLGPKGTLMVDANMAWSVTESIKAAKELAKYDVVWLEEPTIPEDYKGLARIGSEGGVPIAGGENLHTLYEFKHSIEAGALDFPQPDASNIGGITGWMKVARLCEAHNLPVCTHGMQELHVSLMAAIPNPGWLEIHSFPIDNYIIGGPVAVKHGYASAPTETIGTGIVFDFDKLAVYCEEK